MADTLEPELSPKKASMNFSEQAWGEIAPIYAAILIREQIEPAAQHDEPGTDFADRRAIVLAEVGDRLVIRRQPAGQPHYFNVAAGFPFKAPARLNPVEVAGDIELQQKIPAPTMAGFYQTAQSDHTFSHSLNQKETFGSASRLLPRHEIPLG